MLTPVDYSLSVITTRNLCAKYSLLTAMSMPCGNDFLYHVFGNYDLKMSNIGR